MSQKRMIKADLAPSQSPSLPDLWLALCLFLLATAVAASLTFARPSHCTAVATSLFMERASHAHHLVHCCLHDISLNECKRITPTTRHCDTTTSRCRESCGPLQRSVSCCPQ